MMFLSWNLTLLLTWHFVVDPSANAYCGWFYEIRRLNTWGGTTQLFSDPGKNREPFVGAPTIFGGEATRKKNKK